MKKLLVLPVLFFSGLLMAETGTVTIKGMHCNSCKKIVTKTVCQNVELKKQMDSCEVSVDTKAEVGTLVFKTKKDASISKEQMEALVKEAGDDYKVTGFEIKK